MRSAAAAALLFLAPLAHAQDTAAPPADAAAAPANVVYTGPLALLTQHWHLEYERVLNPSVGAFVIPTVIFNRGANRPELQTRESMFGADFGLRLYTSGRAPDGFWLGPLLGFYVGNASHKDVNDDAQVSGMLLTVSGQLGYTALLASGVALSFGGGLGYGLTTATAQPITIEADFLEQPLRTFHNLSWAGFNINARVSVGMAF